MANISIATSVLARYCLRELLNTPGAKEAGYNGVSLTVVSVTGPRPPEAVRVDDDNLNGRKVANFTMLESDFDRIKRRPTDEVAAFVRTLVARQRPDDIGRRAPMGTAGWKCEICGAPFQHSSGFTIAHAPGIGRHVLCQNTACREEQTRRTVERMTARLTVSQTA